ncbi:hypothetical protein [Mycobacterium sp.]|uniref:hypothetical protein n=1 Tax=Mycobacterium sp. TaxID=1785 RepID=UPI003D1107CB
MSDNADPFADESLGDDVAERDDVADEAEAADAADQVPAEKDGRHSWARLLAVALPVMALALGLGVAYLKWVDGSARESRTAAAESVRAATESTIAILSYKPETVDRELKAASDRLTGGFSQQYTQLVNDVVAPGAKQQHISAVASVPAAASVSATGQHAVVLLFVDQTTSIGNDAPTQSTSSVRVTLETVHGRWLISQFDPV